MIDCNRNINQLPDSDNYMTHSSEYIKEMSNEFNKNLTMSLNDLYETISLYDYEDTQSDR
jgi:hypothetical protein